MHKKPFPRHARSGAPRRTVRQTSIWGKKNMKNLIPRGLVVSCQALKNEPLYGGDTIPKMAFAAKLGGAVGIRANTVRDINGIRRRIGGEMPIIGLIKRDYEGSPVYITPTLKEVKALIGSACDVIAMDATARPRPKGVSLAALVKYVREHSDKALMADVATFEEAMAADALGFDYISTTLRSYTAETEGFEIPDPAFCRELLVNVKHAAVIAEGGVNTFASLRALLDVGVERVIIGGAITRPKLITEMFCNVFTTHEGYMSGGVQ